MALRRNLGGSEDDFPNSVMELKSYFDQPKPERQVRATPGEGLKVPIWLLGSSLFSARLAAMLGLPYAFASHFAPTYLDAAVTVYRERFQPSETLKKPYVIRCQCSSPRTQTRKQIVCSHPFNLGHWKCLRGNKLHCNFQLMTLTLCGAKRRSTLWTKGLVLFCWWACNC